MANQEYKQPEKNLTVRLQQGIMTHRRLTEPMRMKRAVMLEEYAAGFYDNPLRVARKPLNMVFRGMSILVPLLAAQNPKAMVRSRTKQLRPYADTMRLALNHLIEEIDLEETIRTIVVNSMMYMGISKTGIAAGGPGIEDAKGYLFDPGQLYCENVDPSDYVYDMGARVRQELDFEGNAFRVPLEYIIDSGLYSNYDHLKAVYAEYGDRTAKRPEKLVKTTIKSWDINEIKKYTEIYEIWIPGENIIMTIPANGQGDKPLRIVEWDGPERGPYDVLTYHTFPESIVPIPPVYSWLDLHHYLNTMARKMGRQADREKNLLVFEGSAEQDANTIKRAEDGESVRVDDIKAITNFQFGGINDQSYQYVAWLKANWSEMAGNADLIGGVKSQAGTLGQEQMLMANATGGINDMTNRVYSFVKSILSKMAWYQWTDPLLNVTITKRIPGVVDLDIHVTPEAQEGDFVDYEFSVEPYSMARMDPSVRRRAIMEIVQGIIVPLMPIAMAQGDKLNVAKLVKAAARDLDLTDAEIDEIYESITNMMETQPGPYTPQQGQMKQKKSGQSNDAFGASDASRTMNSTQQQNRAGGRPSMPQK